MNLDHVSDTPNPNPSPELTVPLPVNPILIGGRVVAQAAIGATPTPPLGTDLTAGVGIVLGL
jgi:hypothetical protein